jgi:hypothetical protein
MALAILELMAVEAGEISFRIDTGTNKYYQLKIGKSVRRKSGIDWVDEVIFSTPVKMNEAGDNLWNSSKQISIPTRHFDRSNAYVQLFSFKTPQGKSPAFSRVIHVPIGLSIPDGVPPELAASLSFPMAMNEIESFHPPHRIPCTSHSEKYATQASLEDLLAGIIKLAAPAISNLINGVPPVSLPSVSSNPTIANGTAAANILTLLLKTILGSVPSMTGSLVPTSQQQSLNGSSGCENRFLDNQNAQFSQPFIFGIDDALLGTLIGPVIQLLPQLMNAANQRRLQMKQSDNKLVSDILSEVNKRMLLEQLLQAQRQAPAGGQQGDATDLNSLIQLLQQVPATSQPGIAPAASQSFVENQSLSGDKRYSSTLSSKFVASFVTADPVQWNGVPKVLFAKDRELQLKIQLNVADPVPKTPLPKAILKIVFKDSSNQSIYYEKMFKQKDILPNNAMTCPFSPDELSHVPVNIPISLFAEVRWVSSKTNGEYKAVGAKEIVLVNKYFLKEQGKAVSTERELTDMKRFRPFWNKVWESPVLDAASGKSEDEKKYHWELNVNAKYLILLSADREANGLMETKMLRGQVDEQSLSEKTEGRMKAGIELSIAELNKLMPLWDGESVLDYEKLAAFKTLLIAENNAGEFIYNFKLKGRASDRGMIWVVPIFNLFNFTLNTIQKIDDNGQIIAVGEENVRFPLPVSARVIGLKSQ